MRVTSRGMRALHEMTLDVSHGELHVMILSMQCGLAESNIVPTQLLDLLNLQELLGLLEVLEQ